MEYIVPSFILLIFLIGIVSIGCSMFEEDNTPTYIPTNNKKNTTLDLDDDDLIIVANELFEDE
tara:strand:- start:525 stop:713 length:189 start_codon:yes stop_codon:yes gene_type:complete